MVVGLVLSLLMVLLQDLKYRNIHVVFPILIFVFSGLLFHKKAWLSPVIYLTNAAFFTVILIVLIVYMSIKDKKFVNPFTHYFGLGDLLFYLSITPLFATYHYVLFFILSMLFAIILHLSFKKIIKGDAIPLAGFAALLLLLLIGKDLLFTFTKTTLL